MNYSKGPEAIARQDLIDPALLKARWDVHNPDEVGLEIPVDGFDAAAWKELEARLRAIKKSEGIGELQLPAGIADYVLYRENGEILAVVEAKKTSIDPRLAQTQAEFYVEQIEKRQSFRPFAFMTNGIDIYFLDVGEANKRPVTGFFSREDLENLLWLRQNGQPLSLMRIDPAITDRAYQQEAIRRVCDAFEVEKRRRALLIMATGTGKTRTVMSIVDIFLRAGAARRVLFVADRDELVKQALDDGFKRFLPNEPHVRIYTGSIDKTKRLYVATLQTMNICYQEFTPGYFDLIIFDEVHRSIFNQWKKVLDYFDARMIGLTATPASFVDRNTFLAFEITNGVPTFLYDYQQAVEEGYLVDFALSKVITRFQRRGIKGVDLSEEARNALIEQGLDPDEIDFAGTDLEKEVSNRDTLRKQWAEIMEKGIRDQSGQLLGKTIVFAITQEHALRLLDVFEEMYPQWPGMARVITHMSDYKGNLIADFKKKDMPRIAITVDLLETGVDVPEVVNLVFMKPVHSQIKLWQMIGRGTRSNEACTHPEWLPDGVKREFLILDFWENEFGKAAEEERVSQDLPVQVTIFNTRLKLLTLYLNKPDELQRAQLIAKLREQIALIPTDSFAVKRVMADVGPAWGDNFWLHLNEQKVKFLGMSVGPLLRYVGSTDVAGATFTSKVERLKLQILQRKDTSATVESIAEDVSRLPDFVINDPQRRPYIDLCLSPRMREARSEELDEVIVQLADQMKLRREKQNVFVQLDLPDMIETSGYIYLNGGTEKVLVQEYRERVEDRVRDLIKIHPTMQAVGNGEMVSDEQLLELERTLRHVVGSRLELSEGNIRRVFGWKVGSMLEFLRRLLDLSGIPDYAEIVERQFNAYIGQHNFSAEQILFLRLVKSQFLQRRQIQLKDLYRAPYTNLGGDVERWFAAEQVEDLLSFTRSLAA